MYNNIPKGITVGGLLRGTGTKEMIGETTE